MLDGNVGFNNTGTVSADSGTLAIEGGGINSGSGTFTTANGGLLVLDGISFANSVTISSGTIVDLGGNTSVNGVLSAPELQLVGGTLSETNVLLGMLTWSGGSISGVLTVATNSVLNIVNGGGDTMDGLVLTNYGTINWTNTTIYSQVPSKAQIYNYGLWNAQSDDSFQGGDGLDAVYTATNVLVLLHHPPPTVQLAMPAQALAGHTFAVAGSGTCLEGTVTNFALMVGSNVLFSTSGSSARVNYSCDFPGNLTITAIAMVNTGTQGQTNATVTIITLPVRTLDAIGFEANGAFKLLMLGSAGTNYQVLVSTNLAASDWTALGTMENTNGIWRCFDTAATNSPERFYRAKQLP